MSQTPEQVQQLVAHLFRHEAGRIVSVLTRIFGLNQIELAEDIVQDTLMEALHVWSTKDIPTNPPAWLMQVAKRKTINHLKRQRVDQQYRISILTSGPDLEQLDEIFLDHEIKDSQLRMIFTCCHPANPIASQIALTLKTLCGFSVRELAHALLTTDANINKRLLRAKQAFRNQQIQYEIPSGEALIPRLDAVLLTLYLLFNEGYHSSHHQQLIREDLCAEAIRLGLLLTAQLQYPPKACALLALMYFQAARFDARLDQTGAIILLEEQNRELWDKELIQLGTWYLSKSASGEVLSEYHLEAGIAAEHCLAESYEQTNWQRISDQYEILSHIKPSPIIELNRAITLSKIQGPELALDILHKLKDGGKLNQYYLLPASIGELYIQMGDLARARDYLLDARTLAQSPFEKALLDRKIARL